MKKAIILVGMIGLVACASQTPRYEMADGADDYGYTDTQLSDNRYRVNFTGNTQTNETAVRDMVLLRAAQLTMVNDYDWFRVVSRDERQTTETEQSLSSGVSQPSRVTRDCGLLGCTTTVSPAYSGINVVATRELNRFKSSIEIVMGEGEVEDQTTVYNARELYSNLETQYQ